MTSTTVRGSAVPALVGLAVVVAVLAGLGVRATTGARLTADEPYYLLTATSLAGDGDLDIADEIAEGSFRAYHAVDLDEQTLPLDDTGRRVSPHDPLLSVLLVPAGWLARTGAPPATVWLVARVLLALVAGGLAATTAWTAIHRLRLRPTVVAVVVAGLGAAMPLAAYGTQVYPELPAALVVALAVAVMTAPTLTVRHLAIVVAMVVALPWLSVKYVPVAAAIALASGVRAWRHGQRRAVLTAGGVLVVAGMAYLVAHQAWYGGWTVYAAGDHFADAGELSVIGTDPDHLGRARRLVGLLVDRRYGLGAWTPAWLALPAAVAVTWRIHPSLRGVLLGPLTAGWLVATFVALTMHGWWSPGRQVVVVAPLGVLAICVLVGALERRVPRWVGMTGLVVLVAGPTNWLWRAVEASTAGPYLVVDNATTAAPAYRLVARLMPDGILARPADDLGLVAWAVVLLGLAWLASKVVSRPQLGPHVAGAVRRQAEPTGDGAVTDAPGEVVPSGGDVPAELTGVGATDRGSRS